MADFSFLAQYKAASSDEKDIDRGRSWKHLFFPVQPIDLLSAENELGYRLPEELDQFYSEIGYGFFYNNSDKDFNRFLAPDVLVALNLRQDEFEFDPDLELYENPDHLIFFQVNEGVFLSLDKTVRGGSSPVYYILTKISDSLEEFLKAYDKDPDYLNKLDT